MGGKDARRVSWKRGGLFSVQKVADCVLVESNTQRIRRRKKKKKKKLSRSFWRR